MFFSGYAIQQRTLRDLRAAIKPQARPSPLVFLPDRFKATTTELKDGTIVTIENDDDNDDSHAMAQDQDLTSERTKAQDVAVEVKPTLPEEVGDVPRQKVLVEERKEEGEAPKQAERPPRKTFLGSWGGGKAEKQRAKGGATDADGKKKPISRAERRRLIKEEIKQLSQGESPVYYQRRLW